MKNTLIALSLTGAILAPLTADAFTLPQGIRVNPVDEFIFEVIPTSSGTFSDFWCGASEYARRVQNAGWTDVIYVVQGRANSVTTNRRTAVQFTLSPEQVGVGPPPQGWLALGIKPGSAMSVQRARGYCDQSPISRN